MNENEQKHRRERAGFVGLWPWLVFPILPLFGAFAVLHFLYAPEFTFAGANPAEHGISAAPTPFTAAFLKAEHRSFIHFEGLMIYVSVASFHVVLCVLTILYCSFQIRQGHKAVQTRTWSLLGSLLLLLIVAILVARTDQTAVQLTYRNTCELLKRADVAVHIMPPDCRSGSPSLLAWLAILPFVSGIVAAVFATAVASLAAEPLPASPESAWRSAFAGRARTLQRVFYVVSLVLVTSTISIMLFLQLPLVLAADEATKLAVTGHAQGMTVFWGTVFTLTLVMMFAPSAFLLLKTARQYEKRSENPAEVRAWWNEQIYVSLPKQLGNVATLLAPLLAGPAGALLEKLVSSG